MAETTQRVLRLLGLLQSRPVWTGPELADRLGVTTRSIRRDVDRLRDLGYPVNATQGLGGGYQLGAGKALPPLLLDDEEAVSIAVCLRMAAGGTVEGIGEAALRTLAKLDQVLPKRLRPRVEGLAEATVTLTTGVVPVDADVLLTLAAAIRARFEVGFDYTDYHNKTSTRRVEPYRLVATGRRWYLLCYDRDREDWRVFRLDRMSGLRQRTWQFRAREAPDAAEIVQRGINQAYEHLARFTVYAPASEVRRRLVMANAQIEPLDHHSCQVSAGYSDAGTAAWRIVSSGLRVEINEPESLRTEMRQLGERLIAATTGDASAQR